MKPYLRPPGPHQRPRAGKCAADDGEAARFDCSEVDLLAFLTLEAMGANRGVRVNDVRGWTEPGSGREIAILGMTGQTVSDHGDGDLDVLPGGSGGGLSHFERR